MRQPSTQMLRMLTYEKNPKAYTITKRTVKKGDVLKLQQVRGGGFAISLKVTLSHIFFGINRYQT